MPAPADVMPENILRPSPAQLAQDLRALTAYVDLLGDVVVRLAMERYNERHTPAARARR